MSNGAAHIHSLLHINVNSGELEPSRAFYADVLEQTIGMETSATPVDGSALGFDRFTTTKVLFFYDHRGPRAAPAVELMGWIDPLSEGTTPAEPNHIGLAAIGYAVPSLDAMVKKATDAGVRVSATADAYPLKDAPRPVVRLLDVDGCAIEVFEADVPSPQFSYLRLTVADLDKSIEWYGRIGLVLQRRYDDVQVTEAESAVAGGATLSVASLSPAGDPSLSFELTSYSTPAPVGKPISPANHVGLYRIATAVEDVNAARAELADGWDAVPEPVWVPLPGTKLGGVNVLFLTDPDGMVVEQVERPRKAMSGRS
jgi:catechol 2,3-dioxygenase-like lactoylglutathione lyase family enzyme